MCRYDDLGITLHYITYKILHYNTLHYNRFVLLPTLTFLACSRVISSLVEHFLPLIPKKYQYFHKKYLRCMEWSIPYIRRENINILLCGKVYSYFPALCGKVYSYFPALCGKVWVYLPQSKYLLYLTGKVNKFRSLINNSIYYLKYQVLG